MIKTRFTETQIVKAISEYENGRKAEDYALISSQPFLGVLLECIV
jgi:hypothetical protein